MLSILCVRLTIKVKVGIPDSFKVGWYPPPQKKKKMGRVTLIQTLCTSRNIFHLRADCSLCNTTLKPLITKIQCYRVLIYSTCNPIKTSSRSSSYSRYYELVYFSVCVLEVFSGRALTVVLQKIIITNTFYDLILHCNLCGDLKANFSMGFILFL